MATKSFSLDMVRGAWDVRESQRRRVERAARMSNPEQAEYTDSCYRYVREVWTDFVLVQDEGTKKGFGLTKVPFEVDDKGTVKFGAEKPVRAEYVELSHVDSEQLWVNPHGPAVNRVLEAYK